MFYCYDRWSGLIKECDKTKDGKIRDIRLVNCDGETIYPLQEVRDSDNLEWFTDPKIAYYWLFKDKVDEIVNEITKHCDFADFLRNNDITDKEYGAYNRIAFNTLIDNNIVNIKLR